MIESTPRVITGIFSFEGFGYGRPVPLGSGVPVSYTVPSDRRAQLIYFRAGNSCDEMIGLILSRNGSVMRMFPLGAKAAVHVPLAVVEDLMPETKLDVLIAAPDGIKGTVLLDMGLVEI